MTITITMVIATITTHEDHGASEHRTLAEADAGR